MEAICKGDVDGVLNMYSEKAVLVPTLVNEPIRGKEELRAYFEDFLSKPNLCGDVHMEIDQNLGNGYRSLSGTYTFRWDGEEGVEARYTFVVRHPTGFDGNSIGDWSICTHHSSEYPFPS